jgi:NH3-dependent NAD+ synthetase
MATDKLFTIAGITKHSATNVTVEKVRYGTDMIRLVKTLNNPKKIWHKPSSQCLAPQRVDLIELPSPMTKVDALGYLSKHADFQSPVDQAVIQDALSERTAKPPKAKDVKVAISMEAIKARIATKDESTT